jgi:hypothetical protein
MWQYSIRNRSRGPTFAGVFLTLSFSIHNIALKIKPSAGTVHSPPELKNGFMPGAGVEAHEDESGYVV